MTGGSSQNVVSGNYIGLNRLGTAAIGNGRYGIFISVDWDDPERYWRRVCRGKERHLRKRR